MLSWGAIETNAVAFAQKWKDSSGNEKQYAQTFENEFLSVFGVDSNNGVHEHPVRNAEGVILYIDYMLPQKILIEMKSKGESLIRAYNQAYDYSKCLKPDEYPELLMVCDFDQFQVTNLRTGQTFKRFKLIPIGYLSRNVIAGDKLFVVADATLYHFGVLTSSMHMAWMRRVCGRLEMRYSYSNTIVYNNFPWPDPTDSQRSEIERYAQAVLDARELYSDCSLADLYDPTLMPVELTKAHQHLDRAVEKAYGRAFASEEEMVSFLFERYEALAKTKD